MYQRLVELGVTIMSQHLVLACQPGRADLVHLWSGQETTLDVDSLALVTGRYSRSELYNTLLDALQGLIGRPMKPGALSQRSPATPTRSSVFCRRGSYQRQGHADVQEWIDSMVTAARTTAGKAMAAALDADPESGGGTWRRLMVPSWLVTVTNGRTLDADGERTASTSIGQPPRRMRPDVPLRDHLRLASASLYGLWGTHNLPVAASSPTRPT